MKLNKIQKKAAEELTKDVVLMAGAGTGKTQVLTNRFINILKNGEDLENILAITFTKKAASDMKRKIKQAISIQDLEMTEIQKYFSKSQIFTIHGFCSEVISMHPNIVGVNPDFSVLETIDSEKLLKDSIEKILRKNIDNPILHRIMVEKQQITTTFLYQELLNMYYEMKNLGMDIENLRLRTKQNLDKFSNPNFSTLIEKLEEYAKVCRGKFKSFYATEECQSFLKSPNIEMIEEIKNNIGTSKGNENLIEEINNEINSLKMSLEIENEKYIEFIITLMEEIQVEFKNAKKSINGLDYDDLQEYAKEILKSVKMPYSYVMVDEFQDTNHIQVEILDLLKESNENLNLFVVGDPKQSIYSFRGGSIETYKNYISKMSENGAIVLELTENYRSTRKLIESFNHLFSDLMKDEYSSLSANLDGDVKIKCLQTEDELVSTANYVQHLIENGVSPGEIALLYRKKAKMFEMEKELLKRGIAVANTATKFSENREIRDVLLVLRILAHKNDIINHLAYLKTPEVGLSENAIFLLANEFAQYGEWGEDFLNILNQSDYKKFKYAQNKIELLRNYADVLSLSELIQKILDELKFFEINYYFRGEVSSKNLSVLISYAINFQKLYSQDIDDFVEYIENLNIEDEPSKNAVNLITTHKSKGLEFDYVILTGCSKSYALKNQSNFIKIGELGIGLNFENRDSLYKMNINSIDRKQIEEELRIFYVACTRAKKSLTFVRDLNVKEETANTYINLMANSSFSDFDYEEISTLSRNYSHKSSLLSSVEPNKEKMINETLIRQNYYKKQAEFDYYSVSQFMTYKMDKDVYFEKYVLGIDETKYIGGTVGLLDPIIRGNIIHKYAEISPKNVDEFIKFELKKYDVEENPKIYDELKKLMQFYDNSNTKDIIAKEWEFYVGIGNGIIHGFIDQIRETKDGIEIVDLKTGKMTQKKLEYYSVQLQVYAYAYKKITNKKIICAKIVSLEDNQEYNIDISEQAIGKTISEFDDFIKDVENLY